MRIITIFSLKSLTYLNKVKLTDKEKSLNETEFKLNNEYIKDHCYVLRKKPRNLQYSFVTDLFKNDNLDKTFLEQIKKNNYYEMESIMSNEPIVNDDSIGNFLTGIPELSKDNQVFTRVCATFSLKLKN